MARNQDKEQQTIRKGMDAPDKLRATVQSGKLDSFVFGRPGRVERDHHAGMGWKGLAESLRYIDSSLSSALLRKADIAINEGAADGTVGFDENPDVDKNMKAFADLVREDPEKYAGKSPYFYIGYEKRRHQSSLIGYEAHMKEFYNTSGLVNEQNSKKAEEAIQKESNKYITEHGLNTSDDMIMLAENFTGPAGNIRRGILVEHTRQREAQRLELVEQQAYDNLSARVQNLKNIGIGGSSLNVPRERQGFAYAVVQELQANDADFDKLGIPLSRRMALVHKFVIDGDFTATTAEAIAKDFSVTGPEGKPMKLINQPGVAQQIRALKDKEEARTQRSEQREAARDVREHNRLNRAAIGNGAAYGQDNEDFSYETMVIEKKICAPEQYNTARAHAEAAYKARHAAVKKPNDSREAANEYNNLAYSLSVGDAGMADVLHYSGQGYDVDSTTKLMGIANGFENNAKAGLNAATDLVMKSVIATQLGISMEDAQNLVDIKRNGNRALIADQLSAFNAGAEASANFMSVYETEKSKAKKEYLPQDATTALAKAYIVERNAKYLGLRKQTKQYKELTNMIVQQGGEIKNNAYGPVQFEYGLGQEHVSSPAWDRSLGAFNTLFPDYVWEDAKGTPIQPKSAADLIAVMQRTQPGATWADYFFVVTGSRPEALQVRTETEARAYLEAYRKRIHKNREVNW